MTPEELKKSIIEFAVQGRLKLYSKNDESIYDTFAKEGITLTNVKEEDIDNEYPAGWACVYLNNIASFSGGFAFKSTEYTKQGIRIIRISDFSESGILNKDFKYYEDSDMLEDFVIKEKDILMCMTGGTVGKSCHIDSVSEKMVINQRVAKISVLNFLDSKYVYYVLNSASILNKINKNKTSTNDNISMQTIKNFLIPLPPVNEQRRIVQKIEEFWPLIEKYDKSWGALEEFNKQFPLKMEKSILHFAIRGKLVEQIDSEGTAKDLLNDILIEKMRLFGDKFTKKIKQSMPIENTDIPFDIPNNWEWVRLSDICNKIFAGGDKPADFVLEKDASHQIPVIANGVKNDGILGFTSAATANKNSITVAGRGTIGFSFYRTYDYCPIVRLIVLEQSSFINPRYLIFVLNALLETGEGTSIPQLTVPMLSPKLIPLPPRAEQDRIVEKIDQLLPLCKKLVR